MTGLLWPAMAREIRRDLFARVHVIDLGVRRGQVVVTVLLYVLERVAGTRQQNRLTWQVVRVERHLETAFRHRLGNGQAECDLRHQTTLIPVPEHNLPVGCATQRHNEFLFTWREGSTEELLGLETVSLIGRVRQGLTPLWADDLVNGDETFFALSVALTNRNILAIVICVDVGDGFSALSAYKNLD